MRLKGAHNGGFSRLASLKDVIGLLVLCGGYLVTAILPRRWDGAVVDRLTRLFLLLNPRRSRRLAGEIGEVLGPLLQGRDLEQLARRRCRALVEDLWGLFRSLHPMGWRPQIDIEGVDHLHRALARGRGVVLWMMSMGGHIVVKQALWRAGLPLTHLSSAMHGAPSRSWLALNVIAPFRTSPENRLAERVIIPLDRSLGYLRTLSDRLAQNRCVSIVGELQGRQNVETSLFGRPTRYATGAPSLAWRSDAALVTVYVVRRGAFRYRVIVENPIPVDRTMDRKQFVESAVHEFSRRLERHIADHPADWNGWRTASLTQSREREGAFSGAEV